MQGYYLYTFVHVFIAGSNEWKRLEVDQWPPERFVLYRSLSKIRPWGMNLSGSSKRRWVYFWELWYFSLQIHPPHTQFTCSSICVRFCNTFCHALAYAITANVVCLHSLAPPPAQCCFFRASCLDITAYQELMSAQLPYIVPSSVESRARNLAENAPYKVSSMFAPTSLRSQQVTIITAGRLLRIHTSHSSNLKAR